MSTRTHGMLDYLVGALMIAAPWLFGFADVEPAQRIFLLLGIAALLYSAYTDYELGIVRALPMRVHLMLDIGSGVLLALSPWLFGFADRVMIPHVLFGLLEIGAAMMTRRVPAIERV